MRWATLAAALVFLAACGSKSSSNPPPYDPVLIGEPATVDGQPVKGVTGFGQTIPGVSPDLESFPGQSGYWDLNPDLSLGTGGFDGPFDPIALHLALGHLTAYPPTSLDQALGDSQGFDDFPAVAYADLTWYTPLFDAAAGVVTGAIGDPTVNLLPPISGKSALLNGTSNSRLEQPIDLTGVTGATVSWNQYLSFSPLFPTDGSGFRLVLRATDGTLLGSGPLYEKTVDSTGVEAIGPIGIPDSVNQPAILSFEFRGSAPDVAVVDDVVVTGATITNGDFEGTGGWTFNAATAESQNLTTAAKTVCVTGPGLPTCSEPLQMARSFYTSPKERWGRFVDVLTNTGASDLTSDAVYELDLASNVNGLFYSPSASGGKALVGFDSTGFVRGFGLVFGDDQVLYANVSSFVLLARRVTVKAGASVAFVHYIVLDPAYPTTRSEAASIENECNAIATGYHSTTDTRYRDFMTRAQLDAVVNF